MPTDIAQGHTDNFTTTQSFSDTALTAFAQLIALRLDAQRAIVSLIDHENEYFLAESTSTLSLLDDKTHEQNDILSISGARVPRIDSLCEKTLLLNPSKEIGHFPVCLVPDLSQDPTTIALKCVQGRPYLRFYCGVALTNKKGVNIGCVYVVDDRPRNEVTYAQIQFLTMMSATVMDHLENIRAKEEMIRVTMMSQGLHAFIEGEASMDGDWQRLKKYNLPAGAGIGFSWESKNKTTEINSSRPHAGSRGTSRQLLPTPPGIDEVINPIQSPLQYSGYSDESTQFNFNNSPWSSDPEVPQVVPLLSVFDGINRAEELAAAATDPQITFPTDVPKSEKEYTNDVFSNLLHSTFSRASNLVREGMEVDGAVYFDAPLGFYQGRSRLDEDPRRSDNTMSSNTSNGSDDDIEYDGNSAEDQIYEPKTYSRQSISRPRYLRGPNHHVMSLSTPIDGSSMKSDVLGFSTRQFSSLNGDNMDSTDKCVAVGQSLLTALVRRYPLGELFVFDENGPISPPREEESSANFLSHREELKLERHRTRKRAEIVQLLQAFPNARQIFFAPLYDQTSGCFIGSFAWSTSATRIFSIENDLSYLVAFGHSVMAEVSRLNTLSADRAKGDFISNVSHELRSPLHGILASAEFLFDTELDGFQRSLINTVDICGRTLLDTIEHVLDFSKIKKFGQESAMQPVGVVADLDISAIIEEVLEGVFAGFEFNGLYSQGLADTTKSRPRELMSSNTNPSVTDALKLRVAKEVLTVILDIDFREQWKFATAPGTWRRLAMNVSTIDLPFGTY
jgi:signal transduction histidine kinase